MRMMFWCAIALPTIASWNRIFRCSAFVACSGSSNFMAKWRRLDTSTTSQTWLVWPVIVWFMSRYPPISSAIFRQAHDCLPVLLEVDVAELLLRGLIDRVPPAREDLDHPGWPWVANLPRLAVLLGNADHLRVAAEVDVRAGRVERL